MINFNEPPIGKKSLEYMKKAISSNKICGDGPVTKEVSKWFENRDKTAKVLLTTSCTHALELGVLLMNIKEGDEVIMPSYTFVSTANPFILRGATVVFVDIDPKTMNIDANLIEDAITERTKAIAPVHYAGVSCNMGKIMDIAKRYDLMVIEDAAQAFMSTYKGKQLGTIGDFGTYSFHETKNYSMGEGGLLYIRDKKNVERGEIIREKGTDRSKFSRGQVDKYTWQDFGSSYLPGELNVAYLKGQLDEVEEINNIRLNIWNKYYEGLKELARSGQIELPFIPDYCDAHNAHMFYIKARDIDERQELINFLKENGISSVFHYIPLHSSPQGLKCSRFHGVDNFTTKESKRLLRLPLHMHLSNEDVEKIIEKVKGFYYASSIQIRNITLEDTDYIVKWRNSAHVLNNFLDKRVLTHENHNNWVVNSVQKGKVLQFIATVNNTPIGTTFIKNIDSNDEEEVEFGYFIGEEKYLGKGVGIIVGKLTIKEYYNKKFNKPIIARAIGENIASNKALMKIGFELNHTYEDDGVKMNMFKYSGDK